MYIYILYYIYEQSICLIYPWWIWTKSTFDRSLGKNHGFSMVFSIAFPIFMRIDWRVSPKGNRVFDCKCEPVYDWHFWYLTCIKTLLGIACSTTRHNFAMFLQRGLVRNRGRTAVGWEEFYRILIPRDNHDRISQGGFQLNNQHFINQKTH